MRAPRSPVSLSFFLGLLAMVFLVFAPPALASYVPFSGTEAQFQFQNPGQSVRPSPIGPIGYANGVEFVAHLSEGSGFVQVTQIDSTRRLPKTNSFSVHGMGSLGRPGRFRLGRASNTHTQRPQLSFCYLFLPIADRRAIGGSSVLVRSLDRKREDHVVVGRKKSWIGSCRQRKTGCRQCWGKNVNPGTRHHVKSKKVAGFVFFLALASYRINGITQRALLV